MKVLVLLRVEHLQHRRRRVAAVVGGELVDLVEQDDRVDRAGLLHRRDDAAGHGADVGAAVAANLGLVAHAAEADADELAAHRGGDRAAEAGLADARRADQAEDLGRAGGADAVDRQLAHGQEVEDALLDRAPDRSGRHRGCARPRRDRAGPRSLVPGQRRARCRGRCGRRSPRRRRRASAPGGSTSLQQLLLDLGRHAALGDPAAQRLDLVAALAAELVVDRLELLAQVVLALVLVDLVAHAVLDLPLERGDVDLAGEVDGDLLQPAQRIERSPAAPGGGATSVRSWVASRSARWPGSEARWTMSWTSAGRAPRASA